MTKCGYCSYKIEGTVYLIKTIAEWESHSKCKTCGRIHKSRNNKRLMVCGLCYLNFEEGADFMGYKEGGLIPEDFDLTGLLSHGKETVERAKGITVQLLGKMKHKQY